MDLKKYDKLRQKINTKDFEGNNKGLDKWLWNFSFLGNISSIFFAYFLVYPALLKAITLNFITGTGGLILAGGLTLIILSIFEIIKRYLIRNFSNDYVINKRKLNFKVFGWSVTSIAIVVLSFYLSISGSKNLASTSSIRNAIVQTEVTSETDSLTSIYDIRKQPYVDDNISLRAVNTDLRQKLANTPLNYPTTRKGYQDNIDKNTDLIRENDAKIGEIDGELQLAVAEIKQEFVETKSDNETEDTKNILLFVIIVCFNEVLIIGGLYFREYYEYTLYMINQEKFEKMYQKKDRYKALVTFVYNDGKLTTGDRVMSGLDLKAAVAEKTNIQNPNKFVDEFLHDMDRLSIFTTHGKRRLINVIFSDALELVENYDDSYRVLQNIK